MAPRKQKAPAVNLRPGQVPQEGSTQAVDQVQPLQWSSAEFTQSGPLPSAIWLKQYDGVIDGGAERVWELIEGQTHHRQELERFHLKWATIRSFFGLIAALLLAVGFLVGGIFVIMNGHDLAGGFLSGSGIVGIVSAFIYGSHTQSQERIEKAQIMTGKPSAGE